MIFAGRSQLRSKRLLVRSPQNGPHTVTDVSIGPLAGDFPILSLRTNKADVAVGVPQEVADKLDAAGEKWRVNGK